VALAAASLTLGWPVLLPGAGAVVLLLAALARPARVAV